MLVWWRLTCHPDIEHPKRHISQGLPISTCKHLILCHLRYQIMFTWNLAAEHSCTCMYQCPNILLTRCCQIRETIGDVTQSIMHEVLVLVLTAYSDWLNISKVVFGFHLSLSNSLLSFSVNDCSLWTKVYRTPMNCYIRFDNCHRCSEMYTYILIGSIQFFPHLWWLRLMTMVLQNSCLLPTKLGYYTLIGSPHV